MSDDLSSPDAPDAVAARIAEITGRREQTQPIREKTGGRKSLDDFARAFYGVQDGDAEQQFKVEAKDVLESPGLPGDIVGAEPFDMCLGTARGCHAKQDRCKARGEIGAHSRAGITLLPTKHRTDRPHMHT